MNLNQIPRKEYPRPHFDRGDWLNLNGEWNFSFDEANIGEKEKWYESGNLEKKIIVPFTYETIASGIGEEKFCPNIWYSKRAAVPKEYGDKQVVLHFQAADYITKVWVNGKFVGKHQGGQVAFSFNITTFIDENREFTIVVKNEDSLSCHQPRGKQRWMDQNFGCWYVQTTGIWQTVWLEFLNESHLDSVKITPDIDTESVEFSFNFAEEIDFNENLTLKTEITFDQLSIKSFSTDVNRQKYTTRVNISSNRFDWNVKMWSPQHPNLYDVVFTLYRNGEILDRVASYFGMRKISIDHGNVLLNNIPIYQRLLLDQGYWKESHLTPPSEEAILQDIDKTMEMGFNGVRKHMKVEDQRYLYWADKKGLLVWSEMAATFEFSDEAVQNFTEEWMEIVKQQYNHPSIITWTPFNESWGVKNIYTDVKQQKFTEGIYNITKAFDSMRPVIVNDGWEHTVSDILTLHDYVESGAEFSERYKDQENIVGNKIAFNKHKHAMAQGYEYKGQPIIISEYGGIAFCSEEGWGYGNQVKNEEEFLKRFESVTQAIKDIDYISGFCYTQITDVQQEVNGLLTEDRQPKIELKKIREITLK
ncbi:glycoside hydrolase family 2 protein [Paenibacillus nasutitermitis]|uniref:Beta-glucuronidase n=1 Tax=Paenibacillus nasutitermitis TaxID=1652958 RepID=A0A917DQR2_9BACL|nr:sugar-binding domain-containing protein [Paenibacillus nasutitermitis]GGD61875.1 beta-glucuronidase [Paenibacillus nasutitermitis]